MGVVWEEPQGHFSDILRGRAKAPCMHWLGSSQALAQSSGASEDGAASDGSLGVVGKWLPVGLRSSLVFRQLLFLQLPLIHT